MGPAPLVLLHPLGVDHTFWDAVLPHLGGRPVVALDLPGHGTCAPLHRGADVAQHAEAVAAELARRGIAQYDLVGVSLGGLIATVLAATRTTEVSSVTIADAVDVYPPAMQEMWRGRAVDVRASGVAPIIEPTLALWFTDAFRTSGSPQVDAVRSRLSSTDTEGYARACELLAAVDVSEYVTRITCPSCVMCGTQDAPPFRDAATRLAPALGHPTPTWMPGGHAAVIEHPQSFAQALLTFLPSVPSYDK
ncbi:alpha/beta fold hydrolase [Allobranchiibius sp. GilTou38]|uniref:alpha/beta fold hydrolase n=1 Tax=Allobranchiibius sp. GilTou38 TaxID=2815210 RepID=UPI001AA10EBE|nr:alpha/beta fold hydrolase [Allobranchiibius sp. GilTou38]MBO1766740.1 alpha/beta fold hydrolase [Allobranchiibius sp. GilTou38]